MEPAGFPLFGPDKELTIKSGSGPVTIDVESEAVATMVPPPLTVTWLIWGDGAFPATFTSTVMGG
jgi:hypothetical protein